MTRVPRWLGAAALATVVGACTASANGLPPTGGGAVAPVPPGLGSLRQDEITLDLQHEALLIKVTPLDESIIRLTAPDTYQRLSSLARSRRAELDERALQDSLHVFLVSFFSYQPDVPFQPEDLNLLSLGLRFRPQAIVPITPGWDLQRLRQQETQMALYAFDQRVDLESDLDVEYRNALQTGWDRILARVEAERARVRARAARRYDGPPPS
ncbi:MAG: hypothetical protein R3E98_05720 [Gemmatimonadota bacterium]|nr:hypothetical protein [Gemmatimonadota bacterium]